MKRYVVALTDKSQIVTDRPISSFDSSANGEYLRLYDQDKNLLGLVRNEYVLSVILVEEPDKA